MARPTKPKDLKPKAEGEDAPGGAPAAKGMPAIDFKFIALMIVIVLSTVGGSAASMYFLGPMVFTPLMQEQMKHLAAGGEGEEAAAGEEGDEEAHASKIGMNMELDEFTVNLKPDPAVGGNQFLRAKMSLSIGVPEAEDCYAAAHHAEAESINDLQIAEAGGVIAGAAAPISDTTLPVDKTMLANGGGGEDPQVACVNAFKNNMGKYVPTMRDVINAALMKRTSSNLATLEGQETLKDEIKESINQLMDPKYQVVRVNFEDFIIQR